jgi:hypothetical protein
LLHSGRIQRMRGRVEMIVAVAALMVFAVSIGPAAAGDKVSCMSKFKPVTHINADGTECQTSVFGGGSNKVVARASSLGFAKVNGGNGSVVTATASNQGQAIAQVSAAGGSVTASGSGSLARLDVASVGGGKVIAKGTNSVARSHITSANGGAANSDASGGSTAEADVFSTGPLVQFGNGGTAVANAKQGSTANALVQMTGGGEARATSRGTGAEADSVVENVCNATSTAKGTDSMASALCQNSGSVVTAQATNGSTAIGSDTTPPTCTPMNGGTAKVRSPAGNCG